MAMRSSRVTTDPIAAETADGVATVAFNFAGGSDSYLLITFPEPGASEHQGDFHGETHFAELGDPSRGRFGGIATLDVDASGKRVTVMFKPDYPVAQRLILEPQGGVPAPVRAWLEAVFPKA